MLSRHVLLGSSALLALSCVLIPRDAVAQAFLPARGEIEVTVDYQWFDSNEHLLTSAVEGQALTPIEISLGFDFPTKVADDLFPQGRTTTQMILFNADVGITDRFAVMGGVAAGAPRYIGPVPFSITDDAQWHLSFQDARIGGRFLAIDTGDTVVTPFAAFQFPLTDYPIIGHTALGLGLNQFEVGTRIGRVLTIANRIAYVDGGYSYVFTENVHTETAGDISVDRSEVVAEFGYFVGPLTFQVFTNWRHVHKGVDPVQVGGNFHQLGFHGQELRSRDWRLGGAITVPVSESLSVYASYNDLAWGELVDNADIFSVGLSWNGRLFGGLGTELLIPDD